MKPIIGHWSYSSYGMMKKCAYAFYCAYVLKLKGPPVPAMERGTMIHSLAEKYLDGSLTGPIPLPLTKLKRELRALKMANPIVEKFWGVDENWKPKGYPSWCVGKTDAFVKPTKREPILIVVDHKTGRIYPEHQDQASLYASLGFAMYPNVDSVAVEFFYIDQGTVETYDLTRAQLRYNVKYWMGAGKKLMSTKKFLPSPSENACHWCAFRSDRKMANGKKGPCSAWKIST